MLRFVCSSGDTRSVFQRLLVRRLCFRGDAYPPPPPRAAFRLPVCLPRPLPPPPPESSTRVSVCARAWCVRFAVCCCGGALTLDTRRFVALWWNARWWLGRRILYATSFGTHFWCGAVRCGGPRQQKTLGRGSSSTHLSRTRFVMLILWFYVCVCAVCGGENVPTSFVPPKG